MIKKENLKELTNSAKKKKLAIKIKKTFLIPSNTLETKYMFPWSGYDDLLTINKNSAMQQRQKNVKPLKINLIKADFFHQKEKVY